MVPRPSNTYLDVVQTEGVENLLALVSYGVTLVSSKCAWFNGNPDNRGGTRVVVLVGKASDVNSMPLDFRLIKDFDNCWSYLATPETRDGDAVLANHLELPLTRTGLRTLGLLPRRSSSSDEGRIGRQAIMEIYDFLFA